MQFTQNKRYNYYYCFVQSPKKLKLKSKLKVWLEYQQFEGCTSPIDGIVIAIFIEGLKLKGLIYRRRHTFNSTFTCCYFSLCEFWYTLSKDFRGTTTILMYRCVQAQNCCKFIKLSKYKHFFWFTHNNQNALKNFIMWVWTFEFLHLNFYNNYYCS